MNGLLSNLIPLEIWTLVLDKLENDSVETCQSMTDLIYFFKALEGSNIPPCFQCRLKDRWQFLNYTKHAEWSEVLKISPSLKVLADDANLLAERADCGNDFRPIFIVDERTDAGQLDYRGTKNVDIIFCGDTSVIGDFIVSLSSHCSGSSVALIVDCEPGIYSGKKLFGILNADLFASGWSFDKVCVSFPWVKVLECNYMALDTFIYHALSGRETSKHGCELFNRFLHSFKLNFPLLEQIKFVTQTTTRDETCNFIDLSSLMLNKFKDGKIPLMNLFKVHSLENWSLPHVSEFSGHRFKFDETTMTGSPERRTLSLRENLNLLREMAINETIDATPYYRLSLFPRSVKHTRIVNWIPLQSTPIMILKSKSLESLSLKLVAFENAPATVVQGLFLPSLRCLNLEQMAEQQIAFVPPTDRRGSTDMRSHPAIIEAEPCASSMNPVVFSSWNQLTSLHIIQINMKFSHYIFDIQNLKKSLPSINLKKSFETFFDEQQRFIVV
ncbi:hypothetical protein HG536_0H04210 [Torulaspora globosa]|uniref:Uncharacterized protein n=1 Tax=Torulaspora globosa TaxID=48254 RepID=A0A7G3ZNF9_9SACH|nr:uncharacterized protein HG536_0H04210 [Torulaspora globosa]QLL35045.1 hypothetical protein HG536_0H04210 [Torulaspora globosa]